MTSDHTRAALAGFGFGTFLLLWALWSAGFGHGTYLPLGLVGSPVSPFFRIGFLIAPIWWALIGYAISRGNARAALTLIGLHVLGGLLCLVRGTPQESFDDQWMQLAEVGVVMAAVVWPGFLAYLGGIALAVAEARRRGRTPG